jgi:hypothetical protein
MLIFPKEWPESLSDLVRQLDSSDQVVDAYLISDWIAKSWPQAQDNDRLRQHCLQRLLNRAPELTNLVNPLTTRLHTESSLDTRMLSCVIRHSSVEKLEILREPINCIPDTNLQLPLLMSWHARMQRWAQWEKNLNRFLHHNRLRSGAKLKRDWPLEGQALLSGLAIPSDADSGQAPWSKTHVSVVLTAHNAAKTICYAVNSILNQSHSNLELIAIDDASSDETAQQLEALAIRDPRIKIIQNTTRLGTYACRNIGLTFASGDFIANHDADDFAHPDRLNQQLRCFQHHDEAPAVLGQWLRISTDGQIIYHNRRGGSFLHGALATIMLRRDVINRIGFYDPVLCSADTEYLFRIRRVWGRQSVPVIRRPLVLAASLGSGLSSDPYLGTDSFLGDSPCRREYRQAWETWHEITPASNLYLAAETKKRAFPAPSELLTFRNA